MEALGQTLQEYLAKVHSSGFPPDLEKALRRETEEVLFYVLMENIKLAKSIMNDTMGSTAAMAMTSEGLGGPGGDEEPAAPVWSKVATTKFQTRESKGPKGGFPGKAGPAPPGAAQGRAPSPTQSFHDLQNNGNGSAAQPEFGRRATPNGRRPGPSPTNRDRERRNQAAGPRHEAAYRGVEHDLRDSQYRSMKKAIGRGQYQPAAYNPMTGHFSLNEKREVEANQPHTLDNRRRGKDWGQHDEAKHDAGAFGRKFAPRNSEPGGKGGLQFNSEEHEQSLHQQTRNSVAETRNGYARFKSQNARSQITF